jgi:hypothetical protein
MTQLGGSALYAFTALIHLGFVLYLLGISLRRRRAALDEEQVGFSASLTSALTTSHVYEDKMAAREDDEAREFDASG